MTGFIAQEWSYILCQSLPWICEYIVKAVMVLSVGWHEHPPNEHMQSNPCSTTLTRTVKPIHLQSEPGSSRVIPPSLCAPRYLPVQDKQTGARPSTSLQQLTSASVKRSETESAPDKFYKPYVFCPALDQPAPFVPKAQFPIPDHSPRTH